MSFLFTTTNLPEPTKKEMKVLMAIVMQNGLMIQQLQLMCYTPYSISVLFYGCRGHMCCPHVMLLSCSWTAPLLFFSYPLATVPCNEVSSYCIPHGGPPPFLLVATPIPVAQLVYKAPVDILYLLMLNLLCILFSLTLKSILKP